MLSIGFYDQIDEIPNTLNRVILRTTTVGYYYHSVNVISLSLAQSDHIKRLTLYLTICVSNRKTYSSRQMQQSFSKTALLK
jgi:hypothetical protein